MLTRARIVFLLLLIALPQAVLLTPQATIADIDQFLAKNDPQKLANNLIIKDIIIKGNKHVATGIFFNKIPYKKGDVFDATKSSIAINNLYGLGHFKQVELLAAPDKEFVTIVIRVEEKHILDQLTINGNKVVSTKKIQEKLTLDKLGSVDDETLRKIVAGIKKLYVEENHHLVKIHDKITPSEQNPDKVNVTIDIEDGPRSIVFLVDFVGNEKIPSRKLRNCTLTKENWLLSFTDGGGTYNEEMIEIDKHRIEFLYKEHGYLQAKVYNVDKKFSQDKQNIEVTFHIQEGEQFFVRNVSAPGDDLFTEDELLPLISMEPEKPYSYSAMTKSMNKIRDLWGEKGYIYADVYPQVIPDEKTNEVDVTFLVERGKRLFVNRILITGNRSTRDKVIRRRLDIEEGELITSTKLQQSKNAVEFLSFFERDGVNWHVHRISDNLADLELAVQEAKTGNFNFQLSYGSDQNSSKRSARGTFALEKKNLLGLGFDVGGSLQLDRHRIKRMDVHFFDPYIMDSNVSGGLSIYKRWDEYDQWSNSLDKTPVQKVAGSDVKFGFSFPKFDKRLQLIADIGIENIRTNNPQPNNNLGLLFLPRVQRTFQQGTLAWLGLDLVKDTRNHQVYPNNGYRMAIATKLAPGAINDTFSCLKAELQGSAYTALIGPDHLVLGMQLKMGVVRSLEKNKLIPYKELFHMGGQNTVRGFTWGGIGPAWAKTNDPLGGRNFTQFNMELIFPLLNDYSMKGHLFYDTGAGWDTQRFGTEDLSMIKRNGFSLRHSVGFGLNLMNPMPAKIDWGFKLDRKPGESPSEFHLTMNYAW